MSYSLSVPCKSLKAKDLLWRFLQAHHRPFYLSVHADENQDVRDEYASRLSGIKDRIGLLEPARLRDFDPTRNIYQGHHLAYGRRKTKVGFDFHSEGQFGVYMRALLSWAALRVGRRQGLVVWPLRVTPIRRCPTSPSTTNPSRYCYRA